MTEQGTRSKRSKKNAEQDVQKGAEQMTEQQIAEQGTNGTEQDVQKGAEQMTDVQEQGTEQGTNGTENAETPEQGTEMKIEDGKVRVTFKSGEVVEVPAKRFRSKTADITRDAAAEFAYDELLADDPERDNYSPEQVIDLLIEAAKQGEIESPYILSWITLVMSDDEKGDDAKGFQRGKFPATWGRYLPETVKQSVSKSALRERIAELETELASAHKLIAELRGESPDGDA